MLNWYIFWEPVTYFRHHLVNKSVHPEFNRHCNEILRDKLKRNHKNKTLLQTQCTNSGSFCCEATVSYCVAQPMSVYLYPHPVCVTSCGVTHCGEVRARRDWFGNQPEIETETEKMRQKGKKLAISWWSLKYSNNQSVNSRDEEVCMCCWIPFTPNSVLIQLQSLQ